MIIITHNYGAIKKSEMTESFIIRSDYVEKVWDTTKKEIGITFTYNLIMYKIELEGKYRKFLAKDILNMILEDKTIILTGRIWEG